MRSRSFALAVCGSLACCLVFSSCLTVIEGTVHVKRDDGRVTSSQEPAQKAPPPQKAQPVKPARPAPKKTPPKTRYEKQNIVLNLGQTYVVSAQVNNSADLRAECWTSDQQVLRLEGESSSGKGTVKYIFKAMTGGDAVITYKKIQDGYVVLVREIHVTVPHPVKSDSGAGRRKIPQGGKN